MHNKFYAAGIGIYVVYAHSSHTSSSSGGVQPSNSFATAEGYGVSYTRVSIYCCTNTSNTNNGRFVIPTGSEYSNNFGNYGHINYYNHYGCIRLRYYRYYYDYFYPSSYNYDGIHTCKLPDSNGNYLYENFGVYDESWSSKLIKKPVHFCIIIIIMHYRFPVHLPVTTQHWKWFTDSHL